MFRSSSICNFTGVLKIGLSQTSALGSGHFHDPLANWNGQVVRENYYSQARKFEINLF